MFNYVGIVKSNKKFWQDNCLSFFSIFIPSFLFLFSCESLYEKSKVTVLVLVFNRVSSELLQYFSKVIENLGKEFAISTI